VTLQISWKVFFCPVTGTSVFTTADKENTCTAPPPAPSCTVPGMSPADPELARQKYRQAERESLPFTSRLGESPRTGASPVLNEFGVAEVPVSRVYCPNLDLLVGSVSKVTRSRSEIQKDLQVHLDWRGATSPSTRDHLTLLRDGSFPWNTGMHPARMHREIQIPAD